MLSTSKRGVGCVGAEVREGWLWMLKERGVLGMREKGVAVKVLKCEGRAGCMLKSVRWGWQRR